MTGSQYASQLYTDLPFLHPFLSFPNFNIVPQETQRELVMVACPFVQSRAADLIHALLPKDVDGGGR